MLDSKYFMALLLSASLVAAGCSKPGTDEPAPAQEPAKQTIEIQSAEDIESMLSNTGWQTQVTTASSFHLWEQLNPTTLILAENRSEEVLIVGEFPNSDDAMKAYQSLVPTDKEDADNEDTDNYQQSLVSLADGSGYWLFRQIDDYVFAACMQSASDAGAFEKIFTSFQVGGTPTTAPTTGSDESTGPQSGSDLQNTQTEDSSSEENSDSDTQNSDSTQAG